MNIKQSVLNGTLPSGLRVFDAHSHVGDGEYTGTYLYGMPLRETLDLSRKIGIGAIAASAFKALGGDALTANEELMQSCAKYPDELFAYLFYAPNGEKALLAQIEKYKDHKSFIGVKIHPRDSKATLAGKDYYPLYELCQRHGIIILCHTWETEPANPPAAFEAALRDFPKLKLLLGHMGGTYRGCMDSIKLANEYENVYLDINGSLYSQIWLEELVKLAPLEKFIFSTDQAFNDPRIIMGRVLLCDLDDDSKRAILCDNFERAMGRALI